MMAAERRRVEEAGPVRVATAGGWSEPWNVQHLVTVS